MQSSVFHVKQLGFEGTELGLKRQLERQPGIVAVEVEPAVYRVTIYHDERLASRADIRRVIADCGYWCPECDKTVVDLDRLSHA